MGITSIHWCRATQVSLTEPKKIQRTSKKSLFWRSRAYSPVEPSPKHGVYLVSWVMASKIEALSSIPDMVKGLFNFF